MFYIYKSKSFNTVLTLSYAIGQIIFPYYDNRRPSNGDSTLISSYQHFNYIYIYIFCCIHEKSILYTDKTFLKLKNFGPGWVFQLVTVSSQYVKVVVLIPS